VSRFRDAASSSAEPSSTTHPFKIERAAAQYLEASAHQSRAGEQDQKARGLSCVGRCYQLRSAQLLHMLYTWQAQ